MMVGLVVVVVLDGLLEVALVLMLDAVVVVIGLGEVLLVVDVAGAAPG
jgi:hypothetical protein